MSIKPLIILPDPLLRLVSKPIERVDAPLRKLADDMLDTMYDAPGIGLAAIQVGEPLRMLVIDLAKEGEAPAPQIFINPEILESIATSARSMRKAACRSRITMPRSSARRRSRVKYLDRDGKAQEVEAEGLLATCLQHEIDHLNGVLFIDHISKLKRDMVVKKFKKLARTARRAGWWGRQSVAIRRHGHSLISLISNLEAIMGDMLIRNVPDAVKSNLAKKARQSNSPLSIPRACVGTVVV